MTTAYPTGSTTASGQTELIALADRLEAYAHKYERLRDSRCVFTLAYSLMTRHIAGRYGQPADLDWNWIALLAFAFSRRYIDALDAADRGQPPPPAWAYVFDTLRTRRTSVLEALLFSMTVHIVRDLPHALCDVGLDRDGRDHLREYHFMNEVLKDAIEEVQDLVGRRYEPLTRWLDLFAGDNDEIMTSYGIRISRATAWYNANRLVDPRSAAKASEAIDESPRILVDAVMRPRVFSSRLLFRLLRLISALTRRWPSERAALRPTG